MNASYMAMPSTPDRVVTTAQEEKEQFVYSCATCSSVLDVRKRLAPMDGIIDSLTGVCPSCGAKLEDSIGCKPGPVPEGWHGSLLPAHRTNARLKAPLFQRASSFNRFSLDFSLLDRLLQPLAPDNLVMLEGPNASVVGELAAFRAQLPQERGGLDSTTFFIDGGNCSDPYLFASLARRYSLDARKALRRVTSCRVFTMYQLASLLSDDIIGMAETYGSKLVVIGDLLGTFNEPEIGTNEVERLLDAMHDCMMEAKKKLTVIVTLNSSNSYDHIVTPWSDTLVRLSPLRGGRRTRAELLRHPARRPDSAEFTMDQLLFHPDSPLELVR
jgi:DNA-directed RNA polymerase subunit RPC12/RpoP